MFGNNSLATLTAAEKKITQFIEPVERIEVLKFPGNKSTANKKLWRKLHHILLLVLDIFF